MASYEMFDSTENSFKHDSQTNKDMSQDRYSSIIDDEDDSTIINNKSIINTEDKKIIDGEVLYQGNIIRLYPEDPRVKIVQYQIGVILLMFTTLGLNDQATGMLIPVLSSHYSISQVTVANIFLLQTFGYFSACFVNEPLHLRYGVRGALSIACLCVAIPSFVLYTKVSWFWLYLICYFPIGMGIGMLDSVGNCLFSSFVCYKNEFLGVMHGMYGVCSFITPLIINALGDDNWNYFFIIQCSIAALGSVLCLYVFRYDTKEKYEYLIKTDHGIEEDDEDNSSNDVSDLKMSTMNMIKKYPLVSLYAIALFFYLGSEVGTGSWIYTYLIEFKNGDKSFMSYITSSYWLGLTIGRFYFGMKIDKWFVNEYQAVKFFVKTTMLFSVALTLFGGIFNQSSLYFFVFGIVVFSCGMFIGPIFPLLSIVGVDMLDSNVKVKGISTAISIGSIGGAFIPYLDGVLMKHMSLSVFPLLVSISSLVCLATIYSYPFFIKNKSNYFFPKNNEFAV